jgi:N-acetylmuramic acid 6-phosphate etherase
MPDPLPPTERVNEATVGLESATVRQILEVMNAEDAGVAAAVARVIPQIERAVEGIVERLRDGGRLVYLGAGTSGRLATMEAAEAAPTFGVDPDSVLGVIAGGLGAVDSALEGAEDDAAGGAARMRDLAIGPDDVIVGVSASGRTAFVLAAVSEAAALGALTIGLCCDDASPLASAADVAICPLVGAEVIAGSTRLKAGTAQKLVLNMLTTAAMVRLGRVRDNLMIDVRPTNAKLRDRARRIVAEVSGAAEPDIVAALEASGWSARSAIAALGAGKASEPAERRAPEGSERDG